MESFQFQYFNISRVGFYMNNEPIAKNHIWMWSKELSTQLSFHGTIFPSRKDQKTVVLRLPSSLGVMSMSKKGMDPSSLYSSLVNCTLGSMVFQMFQEPCFFWWLNDGKGFIYKPYSIYMGNVVMNWWLLFQILPYIRLPQWGLLESPLQPPLAVQSTCLGR